MVAAMRERGVPTPESAHGRQFSPTAEAEDGAERGTGRAATHEGRRMKTRQQALTPLILKAAPAALAAVLVPLAFFFSG